MNREISVSILDAKNKSQFLEDLARIKKEFKEDKIKTNILDMCVHLDVMDKKFVLNEGISLEYIKAIKSLGMYADVHLMVQNPKSDGYIDKAILYGADSVTIHIEIEDFKTCLNYLLNKKRELKETENRDLCIGVALNPKTDISTIKKYILKIDKVLLMSVEPGKGGQKYIKEVTDKITFLKNSYKKVKVQVDGGINEKTIHEPIRAEVDEVVVGSYLSMSKNYDELRDKLILLNCINTIENMPRRANLKLDMTTLQIIPGGYGEDDILLGINTPDIRKCAMIWYRQVNINVLEFFISSKYHDYRRFAIFVIVNNVVRLYKNMSEERRNKIKLNELFQFFENNLKYVNNWDLTDIAGPNILAYNLYILNEKQRKKKVFKYLNDKNFWVKRIGIVSMLNFVRSGNLELPMEVCEYTLYDEFHLFQKATGWVLREIYKKNPKYIVEYLAKKNDEKKLPSILMSYACEKMTIEEKEKIRKE